MKTTLHYLIAIVFSFFLTMNAFSQTNGYQPFPEDSATFFFEEVYGMGDVSWVREVWLGDTIINGKKYTKRYTCGGDVITPLHYSGGIRQEIENEKIFLINTSGVETEFFVNQYLQVNDTFPVSFRSFFQDPTKIESIDSILIGEKYHKRYNLVNLDGYMEMEGDYVMGVGSTYAFGFEWSIDMQCFAAYGNMYIGVGCPYCEFDFSVEETMPNKIFLEVTPNPCKEEFQLKLNAFIGEAKGVLYDNRGSIVKQISITASETIIDVRGLPKGMYLLKIDHEQDVEIKKIVIQ